MVDYKSQIKTIIDGIRHDMEIMGLFSFQGLGETEELRKCFVRAYEAAVECEKIYKEHFPDRPLGAPVTLCGSDTDIEPIREFYERMKSEDPSMPFDEYDYSDYAMTINQLFIALQQVPNQ